MDFRAECTIKIDQSEYIYISIQLRNLLHNKKKYFIFIIYFHYFDFFVLYFFFFFCFSCKFKKFLLKIRKLTKKAGKVITQFDCKPRFSSLLLLFDSENHI